MLRHTHIKALLAIALFAGILSGPVEAQTKLNLATQVQGILPQANGGTGSVPASSLPATCTVGATFFSTSATAGQNWYGCTSTNTWTQLYGKVNASGTPTTGQTAVWASSTAIQGTDSPCLTGTPAAGDLVQFTGVGVSPCSYNQGLITGAPTGAFLRFNGTIWAPSTVSIPSTGSLGSMAYLSADNVVSFSPTPILGNAGVVKGQIGFENLTSGTITVTPPTGALGTVTLTLPAATGTLTYTVASGTSTMGTSSISGNSCATVVTTSATGVASTDAIIWTPNADVSGVTGYGITSTDGLKVYAYPSANNVNFKVCNGTGSPITPGSAIVFNWRVTR